MAKKMQSYDHVVEDDYIDMDVSSTTFLCYSKSPPPHSREFEFQMSLNLPEKETKTSPADELFYKGKLLPLHLPPRVQMVQKILQSSTDAIEENSNATISTNTTVGKAGSCNVSRELSPEECLYESKKSWSKKLKLISQSSLSLKLKASKAYLKSLFTSKSGCTDEFNAAPKAKETEKKNPFFKLQKERWLVANANATTLMKSIEREKMLEEECNYRKSFSGAINSHLMSKHSPAISSCSSSSSSSFSSVNSSRFHGSQMLNRSSSVNSEMESSIQGAIAYCKKSQVSARKSASDVELCSLSTSRIVVACANQEKPGLCRG